MAVPGIATAADYSEAIGVARRAKSVVALLLLLMLVLQLAALEHAVLSQEQVFAQLRGEGLEHLGQVHRLYMEANGTFSLVQAEAPRPGLSLLPGQDEEFRKLQPVATGQVACRVCGQVVAASPHGPQSCPGCGAPEQEPAVKTIK